MIILKDQEVHFWYLDLDSSSFELGDLFPFLDMEEKKRAEQYYFEKDKKRFVVARGLLRKVLGRYLNQDPNKIVFSLNRFGKPSIFLNPISFNLSHSENLSLIAVSKNLELGVDIESTRVERNVEKIIEKYFSYDEKKYLLEGNKEEKLKKFYRLWTCKEAFIKGIGEGMYFPLKELKLQIQPNPFSVELEKSERIKKYLDWSIHLLNCPIKDAVAAFAVNSVYKNLKIQEWINPSF